MFEKYALFRVLSGLRKGEDSVRGISKKAKVSVSASKSCLDYLFSRGVVKRKIVGNSYLCSFNLSCFLARHFKILLSLNELDKVRLVESLVAEYPSITSITLYGSVARGDDDMKSDIDLLIIARDRIKAVAKENLGREISAITYSMNEWRKKSREDKVFYDRIIIDGIALFGELPVTR